MGRRRRHAPAPGAAEAAAPVTSVGGGGAFGRWAGIVGVGGLLVVLVGLPLLKLVQVGTEQMADNRQAVLDRATAGSALANTVWTGVVVAVMAVGLGAGAAFVTERLRPARSGWLRMAILLPVLVPGFVSALSFIRAYGPGGLSDDVAGLALPGLFGPLGIVAVLTVNTIPISYLIVVAALRSRSEPDLERAARVHGAGPRVTMATVVVPLLAPALLGAGAVVFVAAINAFGTPAVLGTSAGFATVTTRIYQDLALSARPEAFSRAILLALVLVGLALVFVLIAERLLAGAAAARTGEPAGQMTHPGTAGRGSAAAVWAFVSITTVLPLVALTLTALTRGVGLAPVPSNWTLANFGEALSGSFSGALGRSILLSVLAATIVVALGAAVTALRKRRVGRVYRSAVLLTFAVPGSTLAVAVLLAYGASLRDTLLLILFAYLAKLWALGQRMVEGSAASLPPAMYLAARASGASAWTATRTVLAPLIRPALVGAWLLVFLFAFHELTMSSLLHGPGTDTLAVVVLNLQQLGDVPVSAALAVVLTLPILAVGVPILATKRLSRRLLGGGP